MQTFKNELKDFQLILLVDFNINLLENTTISNF
jgi:hypothetical protein